MDNPWAHILPSEQQAKRRYPNFPSTSHPGLRTFAEIVATPNKFSAGDYHSLVQTKDPTCSTMGVSTQTIPRLSADEQREYAAEPTNDSTMQAIPRRNLSEAFDELYVDRQAPTEQTTTPATKQSAEDDKTTATKSSTAISPAGVAELDVEGEAPEIKSSVEDNETRTPAAQSTSEEGESGGEHVPHFYLHPELRRELPQPLVNRVSFYGILHDVNKEATTMAAHDFATFQRPKSQEEDEANSCPLVAAVKGKNSVSRQCLSMAATALLDEERWLLSAIETRGEEPRAAAACPPTFLQAMGEREYEKPSAMETSRTQLWKPSRSWWEAKSGKNPWIEPKSHNKRWRYLWPLIHYHKFLAKCIKKLKRNGIDVKVSVSPVAVFLREEVCAVSDHLAAVSLFTSEQWMSCLEHFSGWVDTDPKAEARLRSLVGRLKLRPMDEPGDLESPLLRSQIDEQFLRAMVAARNQMVNAGTQTMQPQKRNAQDQTSSQEGEGSRRQPAHHHGLPLHPQTRHMATQSHRLPVHTRQAPPSPSQANTSQGDGSASSSRLSYGYQQPGMHWWGNGWGPHFACDESSVQSALSGDSYPTHLGDVAPGMFPPLPPPHHFYPPMLQPPTPDQSMSMSDHGSYNRMPFYPVNEPYYHEPNMFGPGWYGAPPPDQSFMYSQHPPASPADGSASSVNQGSTGSNSSPGPSQNALNETTATNQTPYKYEPPRVPVSPYWGHLDYATLAMTGLVSPEGKPMPMTPTRTHSPGENGDCDTPLAHNGVSHCLPNDVHPLYPPQQFYGYASYGLNETVVPPSPATQFMMPPQLNPQTAAYYAYNYNNGAFYPSPRRPGSSRKSPKRSSPEAVVRNTEAVAVGAKTEDEIDPPLLVRKTQTDDSQTQGTEETETISGNSSA